MDRLGLETEFEKTPSDDINRRIDEEIRKRIEFYSTQPKEAISRRLEVLGKEWDIERPLETNASTLALTGAVLGFRCT